MQVQLRDVKVPSDALARQAKEAARAFGRLLRGKKSSVTLTTEEGTERVTVPREAFELFVDLLAHLANGNAVAVYPIGAELTTQQAADLMNVSRPFLVSLLDQSKIPYRKVGTHRRVQLVDLLGYLQRDRAERTAAIDVLAASGQEDDAEY